MASGSNSRVHIHQDESVAVAVVGSVRWLDTRLARIDRDEGTCLALTEAYRNHGEGILNLISGDFAIVIYDETDQRALVATDRSGIRPLFYFLKNKSLVFGSTVDMVIACSDMERKVEPQSLYNYVHYHVVPGPRSIYKDVYRLLPGHCALLKRGRLETRCYWSTEYDESASSMDHADLKQEFVETLHEAVSEKINKKTTGAFLSGGTDSSTISGLFARARGGAIDTFSIGFSAPGYDEMHYARKVSRHFNTNHHEYYVTPKDIVDAIPRVAEFFDQPFGNASAVPVYYCAKMAKQFGMERLLAGDGGDELFGGNYRYAKQQLLSRYHRIPSIVRNVLEPPLFKLPFGQNIGPVRKLRSYVRQATIPMPARLDSYNLLERFGAQQVFTTDFLHEVDAGEPLRMLEETYSKARADSELNRMLAVDMRFVLADSDLPKVSKMCELAGVDVAYPMLNDTVVALAARLPAALKVRGTKLRVLFKQALRDFLPPEIQAKRKQGFGLPYGVWLQRDKDLQEITRSSLDALRSRKIFRDEFVNDLTETWQGHYAYYGVMIWVLVMLEQWMAVHEVRSIL